MAPIEHSEPVSDDLLLEPYQYLSRVQGKQVSSRLLDILGTVLGASQETLDVCKDAAQRLQTLALLVDDIEDGGQVRRGQPAAHVVYGIPATINSAYIECFRVLESVSNLDVNPAARMRIFAEEMIDAHRGQGLDMYWRDRGVCPDIEQYAEMALGKTGALLRIGLRLLMALTPPFIDPLDKKIIGDVPKELGNLLELTNLFSLYYQIRDDYLDLAVGGPLEATKGLACDLEEGKFSFPLIMALRYSADVSTEDIIERITEIHSARPTDRSSKLEFIALLEKVGAFDRTRGYIEIAHARLEQLMRNLQECNDVSAAEGTQKQALDMLKAALEKLHEPLRPASTMSTLALSDESTRPTWDMISFVGRISRNHP
ncbi:hypothetical protein BOTBODRAFT_418561 [Botryobasidium botryosum FD-172 SS1]|uniref:(2E,6E)-farnesyl diphosphate synthase n=1 Tax=Botryobasidium botryosum (strain FD-172 SS1) TaxID=930990 RepID=A0A067MKY3_BOTB1|nr:hypothetical protein BOTBODRAFT_418561 [Botryobasidium botryosum FD-172 SS1]